MYCRICGKLMEVSRLAVCDDCLPFVDWVQKMNQRETLNVGHWMLTGYRLPG